MFPSSTIIREFVLSLAKVTLEHSVKLCPYRLCGGGVAACLGVACKHSTQHTRCRGQIDHDSGR
jgi:uncharacterized OsmC-like protein